MEKGELPAYVDSVEFFFFIVSNFHEERLSFLVSEVLAS
jgi:hypothetical protein